MLYIVVNYTVLLYYRLAIVPTGAETVSGDEEGATSGENYRAIDPTVVYIILCKEYNIIVYTAFFCSTLPSEVKKIDISHIVFEYVILYTTGLYDNSSALRNKL